MKVCDWCGESLPDSQFGYLTLSQQSSYLSIYEQLKNRNLTLEFHDECAGALIGILREGGERPRPERIQERQTGLKGIFR